MNLRLACFLVGRSFSVNRLRVALSILGIALGVAVVCAIQVMDHNTVQSRLRAKNPALGRVDYELVSKERAADPDEVAQRLAAIPDVAAVGVVRSGVVGLHAAERALGPVRMFGVWPVPDPGFVHYDVVAGSDLSALEGDGGVLVGSALARESGIGIGDTLRLEAAPHAKAAVCRDGVLVSAQEEEPEVRPETVTVRGWIGDRGFGGREQGHVVIGTQALAHRLAPREPAVFHVNRREGSDVDALRQALDAEFVVREDTAALLGESSDERAFRNGVKLLGGLALMLGMFVVFQTLSQSLVERLRQIGLLRCLGASSSTVTATFVIDASLLAATGTVLGLVLGIGIAAALQAMHISSLGMFQDWQLRELPLRPMIAIATLGFLFTLAGAAFPLWRARRLPVLRVLHARGLEGRVDVLRGVDTFLFVLLVVLLPIGYLATTTLLSDTERETQAVLLQLGALLLVFGGLLLMLPRFVRLLGESWLLPLRRLLPLETQLVRKALAGQSGRFAASICGLGIVLLAALALESLTTALHADARAFGKRAMPDTLFVRATPNDAERVAALREIPGVQRVDALRGTVAAPFLLSGLDSAVMASEGSPLAGRSADLERFEKVRSLVVSTRLAHLSGLSAGGSVTLITDGGPVPYLVLAVSDDAGFFPDDPAFAITHPRWMKQDFCVGDGGIERIALRLTADADPFAVLHAVRDRIQGVSFAKTGQDFVDYLVRDVTRDFRLFQILLALILLLAAMGVVNATTIAALGRVREIGVLRALGATRSQLRRAFAVEGLVVGGSASLMALALGIPLGRVVVDGMNRVTGLSAPYAVPWHAVIAVPVIGLWAGMLAAWLPGVRAARMSPAEAVRFE